MQENENFHESKNRIFSFLNSFLKFFKKELTYTFYCTLVQFVKFGVVGVTNTIIAYILNVIVLLILQPLGVSWDFIAGNIISFALSVLWSFYWNNRLVFKVQNGKTRSVGKTLLKTYISYGVTGIILNNALSILWINVLGVSKFIAPLVNLLLSVPLNFIINKFWAFKE